MSSDKHGIAGWLFWVTDRIAVGDFFFLIIAKFSFKSDRFVKENLAIVEGKLRQSLYMTLNLLALHSSSLARYF